MILKNKKLMFFRNSISRNKLFLILVLSFIGIQFLILVLQITNNRDIAIKNLANELEVGHSVVNEILNYRNHELHQSAEILAKDYGFLEAFFSSSQDSATIQSVLENHLNRADADLILLCNLDEKVISQTPENIFFEEKSDAINILKKNYKTDGFNLSNLVFKNQSNSSSRLFQLVKTPINAPNHAADLIIGYEINDSFLKHMRKVAKFDLAIISKVRGEIVLNSSTISNLSLNKLKPLINHEIQEHNTPQVVNIKNEEYLVSSILIKGSDSEKVYFLIAKPLSVALNPFKQIENISIILLSLCIFTSLIVAIFISKRIFEPLNQKAHTDTLTGVGNRRHFELVVEQSINEYYKNDKPFVVFFLDLNKFKEINDTNGHEVGDYVLQIVAQRIQHAVRAYDHVFRFGGDEFAVIIQDCTRESAINTAEKIFDSINSPIVFKTQKFNISTSIGITTYKDNDSIKDFIKRADDAMYHSKVGDLKFVFR